MAMYVATTTADPVPLLPIPLGEGCVARVNVLPDGSASPCNWGIEWQKDHRPAMEINTIHAALPALWRLIGAVLGV